MKKRTPVKMIILLVIISVISILYVRIKIEHIRIGYEISKNNKLEKSMIQERQELRAQFMKLKSPERLEIIADKLGFKHPTQNDIFYIEKATIVGQKK